MLRRGLALVAPRGGVGHPDTPPTYLLRLFIHDLGKTLDTQAFVPEKFRSSVIVADKIWGDGSLCSGTLPGWGIAPGAISIDSTAISIAIADSYDEDNKLPDRFIWYQAGLFADKTDRIEFILAAAIFFDVDAMASSSSAQIINLGSPPSDKLTRANYSGWRAQVLPPIRGARLFGLLDGSDAAPPENLEVPPADKDADQTPKKVNNPAYDSWISRDQIVLGYLLQSIGPEVLPHVQRIETAAGVWQAVEEMFASSCQTKVTNLRIALANTKKLQMSTDAFLTKMQSIVDELAAAGEPIRTSEHVSFILAGLGG
ncbi:hypothetical protein QYE76_027801 [Lolium multiflorum]|uniref:Retrotransposon Copia-like N-terminal domain-containing protein n=1 Tax=Lolium multiflorum TaxID=4521 RepID=A0AAD8VGF7_LOLMU|nr:hypothetical protein QYE76_027801 [Lolium multiflorum]